MHYVLIVATGVVLALGMDVHGQERKPSVVLPESAAVQMTRRCTRPDPPKFDGTWTPAHVDIKAMESRLASVSRLRSGRGIGRATIKPRIEHPERYYRQYLGIMIGKRKLIYINAFCDKEPPPYWEERPVQVCDGGSCYWGLVYDPKARKFSHLELNDIE
jgi:hypothetical protein